MIFPFTAPSVTAQQAASDNPPGRNRATSVRQVASTPDTGDLLKSLPQKYRRRPVSTEEMEYIQKVSFPITVKNGAAIYKRRYNLYSFIESWITDELIHYPLEENRSKTCK
uniref:Uncharacterized protein n=1 Tax=Pyxicephalus adspersus TaxID=30357 RepID=A0AAV3A2X4_PYXAD|nr:TPA: hypothetical protein GDO54_014425 [Pyxicephalus adspersus]